MQPAEIPLRDIHIPEAISWWPPALGWWLLAGLLPLCLYLIYKLYKHLTRKTALQAAKQYLQIIQQDNKLNDLQKITALSDLLRRVAVSIYPREKVASLTGQAWLEFLDTNLDNPQFNSATGRLLVEAPYRQKIDLPELTALYDLCLIWLKKQKEPKK